MHDDDLLTTFGVWYFWVGKCIDGDSDGIDDCLGVQFNLILGLYQTDQQHLSIIKTAYTLVLSILSNEKLISHKIFIFHT